MPSRVAAVLVLLFASIPAAAAPRYMARARNIRMVMRSEPGPAPVPAPAQAEAAQPRLGRVVAIAYRTAPADPPPTFAPIRSIDAEALAKFYPAFESGGGFMPLALGSGVRPRNDVAITP